MEVVQARLPEKIITEVDKLVREGIYETRSDAIRDALRKQFLFDLRKQIGSIPNTGDSVKEVREIRKKLSKGIKSYKDIEKMNKLLKF